MRRYVSKDGFDSDQCGQNATNACKTIPHIIKQLHTVNSFVSQDLVDQIEDVWRKVLDEFQSIFEQMEGRKDEPDPVQPFSTPPPVVTMEQWQTRYIFHIRNLLRFNANLKS